MKILKNKFFRISVVLIIIIIAISLFLRFSLSSYETGEPTGQETGEEEQNSYPDNLLEGVVVDINSSEFIIKIDASKIRGGEKNEMEKTIKISDSTEFLMYDLATEEKTDILFSNLEFGDNVVVATEESTYEEILTRESFTATRVNKMIISFESEE